MVLRTCAVLLFLLNYSNVYEISATRTLSGYKEPPGPGKTLLLDASDHNEDAIGRIKRETAKPDPKGKPPGQNATLNDNMVKHNELNDGHKQLMVHWVGEGSNVIICLAVDPPPLISTSPINPSSVYISYDYGDVYQNKTDQFKKADGNYSTVSKFYNHPKYHTHIVFTDVQNKLLFVTSDYGRTIKNYSLRFTPSEISFHEYQPNLFLALDKTNNNELWITEDFGLSWVKIHEFVKSFYWLTDQNSQQQLIIQRQEPSNLTRILYTSEINSIAGTPYKSYARDVKDLYIKGDYIFYTMKNKMDSYDLFVSYKMGSQLKCVFDTNLDLKAYYIADVTGNRALVAVNHKSTLTNLYVSENLGGNNGVVKFTLSLESVFTHLPNTTWKDTWLHHLTEDPFADVYKVEGLTGIYIASVLNTIPTFNNLGPQNLMSRITFDHGATWRPITAPRRDVEGQLISCPTENNCSLHLSQRFSQLHPESRSISILSSKSAPGILMATGVIGKSLKGHYGVYISTDAGITWRQSLRDHLYIFNMGDHGGILTAVEYLKARGETRYIYYSTDEGEKWMKEAFHEKELRLYGLMTEPGENTTVFTMFGSLPDQHKWIIIKYDFKKVFTYTCNEDDYKYWSPSHRTANHRYIPCIMGQQRTYKRRIPHANCYNGLDLDDPVRMERCDCDKVDFECDFGFVRSTHDPWQCIKNRTIGDPYKLPVPCKVGDSYNRTKGYRKISGDVCINGLEKQYLPDIIPCPQHEIGNMLIYAKREKIIRMSLVNNSIQEVLKIPDLKNVIAIDFDLKNNCVYWADIVSDTIGRLCENGLSPPEILVSNDLVSVEGMALDWMSNNLYFVDGLKFKIELIRTNIHHSGRMRRTILSSPTLSKPRGIAVHPKNGYLFWTDWNAQNPSVKRSDLDGTNIITIADKSKVEWPNGITIDYIQERVYWVDAREDYIGSTDLHGSGFKKVNLPSDFVSHPFAVAVFKDDLYWDDWKRNSIFVANKDHGGFVGTIVANISGLMDLRVIAHGVQEGTNPCTNPNNTCQYICVGSPNPPNYVCLCPDGMNMKNGKCMCPGDIVPNVNFTCPRITGTCATDHFACTNGVCIPKLWSCDDEDDCGDNSDEQQCHTQSCAPNYFVCDNGKCLPQYWRCDYESDCTDGTDEMNCPKQNCTNTQFTCDSGRCISLRWKCDGEDDCRDGSDEQDCRSQPATCRKDEFQCGGGGIKCIPANWRCDGERDCHDNSDEMGCDGNNTCSELQFSCGGDSHKCIYKTWLCDGDDDCGNGADEKNCTSTAPDPVVVTKDPFKPVDGSGCLDYMFTCSNKKCIPIWWKCDGANDCEDESDEIGCHHASASTTPTPQTTDSILNPRVCPRNQFQCASGECIAMSWLCDKSLDCVNGEDEAHCEGTAICDQKSQFKCKMDGSCIALSDVCNGNPDCPDGSDENFCTTWHNLPGPATPSCSIGYFPCDISSCFPLAARCDGKPDCDDGSDEGPNCTKTVRVYQVLQMGVDERGINDTSLLLYWWIPIPDKIKLEFMPSISSVNDGVWHNESWTEHPDHLFSNLKPFTKYNMTIYVRINGTNIIYPPAKYYIASTQEGVPSEPYNVTVVQRNGSGVLVSWNKPLRPNGIIQNYEIYWTPPGITMRLSDNSTAHLLTADFEHNTKYSFYIVAYNRLQQSARSEVKSLTFDADCDLDQIQSLTVKERTNGSITLAWSYNKSIHGFIISVEARHPYPQLPARICTAKVAKIEDLPPGTYFTFKISAFKNSCKGHETSITTSTSGTPLPEVNILQAVVIKSVGTSVKLSWDHPKDSRKNKWIYGIYYGVTEAETEEKSRLNTTDLSATVTNLNACEKYIFSIGIVGPLSFGPLSRSSPSVTTFMNVKAPPKKVSVQSYDDNSGALKMMIQWSPSCPNIETPIGYKIKIYDRIQKVNKVVVLQNTTTQELSRLFDVSYGGIYDVQISTNAEGALFSPSVTYRAYPIMPPSKMKVMLESNGSYVISWEEKTLPASMGEFSYEVLVSSGNDIDEVTASRYEVKHPPFIFTNNSADMYSFAVQVKTKNGHRSVLSEVASLTNKITASTTESSSIATILTPVLILLIISLVALLIYIVKYRRLQTSFTRFTNSHYDTRSEAATFDDNALEEDDSPQIRGFSDDEPLVIA